MYACVSYYARMGLMNIWLIAAAAPRSQMNASVKNDCEVFKLLLFTVRVGKAAAG